MSNRYPARVPPRSHQPLTHPTGGGVVQGVGGAQSLPAETVTQYQTEIGAPLVAAFISKTAEAGNAITVTLQVFNQTAEEQAVQVEVRIRATQSTTNHAPSKTTALTIGAKGTMLEGSGTATGVFRTDANGALEVVVTDVTAGVSRYLWVSAGGNTQRAIVARDSAYELSYA